jgi:hypothetical protein
VIFFRFFRLSGETYFPTNPDKPTCTLQAANRKPQCPLDKRLERPEPRNPTWVNRCVAVHIPGELYSILPLYQCQRTMSRRHMGSVCLKLGAFHVSALKVIAQHHLSITSTSEATGQRARWASPDVVVGRQICAPCQGRSVTSGL